MIKRVYINIDEYWWSFNIFDWIKVVSSTKNINALTLPKEKQRSERPSNVRGKKGQYRSIETTASVFQPKKWTQKDLADHVAYITSNKCLKHTVKDCLEVALTYEYIGDFKLNEPSIVESAKKLGVYTDCIKGMRRAGTKWTFATCLVEAQKFQTCTDWKLRSGASYNAALNGGWVKECIGHMKDPRVKYHLGSIKVKASLYRTWADWKQNEKLDYIAAQRNGWLNEIGTIVPRPKSQNRHIKWTENVLLLESQKYKSKTDWAKSSPSSYKAAKTLGVFEKCTSHM